MPVAGTKQLSLFACMLTASAKQNLAQPPAPVMKPPQNRQRLKLFQPVTSTFPPRILNPRQDVTVSAVAVATPGQDVTLSAVAVAACPVRSRDMSQTYPDREAPFPVLQQDGPGQDVTVPAVAVATPGQDVTLSAVAVAACPVRSVDMSHIYPDIESPVLALQQDGPVPDNVCKNIATLRISPRSSSDLVVVTSLDAGGLWVRVFHTLHCNETYTGGVSGYITSSPIDTGVAFGNVGSFPPSLKIVNSSKISTGKKG